MGTRTLRFLTWVTVLGATASALWLAHHGPPLGPDLGPGGLPTQLALPVEPPSAGLPGPAAPPASTATR